MRGGLPQSPAAPRIAADAFAVLGLIQSLDRPERYRDWSRLETMPSNR